MATMKIKFDSLKSYIDEKVKEAVDDIKYGFIEIMVSEIMCLQTYKLFRHLSVLRIRTDSLDIVFLYRHYSHTSDNALLTIH